LTRQWAGHDFYRAHPAPQFAAACIAAAGLAKASSWKGGATSVTPNGSPSLLNPAGTAMAEQPRKFTKLV
jgi:hypothetical protein